MIRIGDKVRFLNDVGGGIVKGFQGKDVVLVADEDGFEIPTLVSEVVAIDTDDYNIAKVIKAQQKKSNNNDKPVPTSVKKALAVDEEEEIEEEDLVDKELSYKPLAQERRGANELNVLLAFVPNNVKKIAETKFEAYLVNDCNYYVHFLLSTYDGKTFSLRHEGEIAPNTKLFLEEFEREHLEEWERVTVQMLSFKRNKTYMPKPAFSVNLRIEGQKFYKLHTFQENIFFHSPALVFNIVKNDHAARSMFVDAEELREAMQTREEQMPNQPQRISGAEKRAKLKQDRNALIEVDLHATEILDTMAGLQPKDILDYQLKVVRDTLNEHLKERGRRIVFIHGKGEGVLRNALIKELRSNYKQCKYQDASFREYGYGATMITM